MQTDVELNGGSNGDWVVVDAAAIVCMGPDLILDSPSRHGLRTNQYRRALVHDQNDGLTINFNDDYPGGVTIGGVTGIYPRTPDGDDRIHLARPVPTLVVHGDISYTEYHLGADLVPVPTTRVLSGELARLRDQVAGLTARVTALEAR